MSGDSSFKILFTHLLKYILTVFITRMSSPAILDTNQNKVNIISLIMNITFLKAHGINDLDL